MAQLLYFLGLLLHFFIPLYGMQSLQNELNGLQATLSNLEVSLSNLSVTKPVGSDCATLAKDLTKEFVTYTAKKSVTIADIQALIAKYDAYSNAPCSLNPEQTKQYQELQRDLIKKIGEHTESNECDTFALLIEGYKGDYDNKTNNISKDQKTLKRFQDDIESYKTKCPGDKQFDDFLEQIQSDLKKLSAPPVADCDKVLEDLNNQLQSYQAKPDIKKEELLLLEKKYASYQAQCGSVMNFQVQYKKLQALIKAKEEKKPLSSNEQLIVDVNSYFDMQDFIKNLEDEEEQEKYFFEIQAVLLKFIKEYFDNNNKEPFKSIIEKIKILRSMYGSLGFKLGRGANLNQRIQTLLDPKTFGIISNEPLSKIEKDLELFKIKRFLNDPIGYKQGIAEKKIGELDRVAPVTSANPNPESIGDRAPKEFIKVVKSLTYKYWALDEILNSLAQYSDVLEKRGLTLPKEMQEDIKKLMEALVVQFKEEKAQFEQQKKDFIGVLKELNGKTTGSRIEQFKKDIKEKYPVEGSEETKLDNFLKSLMLDDFYYEYLLDLSHRLNDFNLFAATFNISLDTDVINFEKTVNDDLIQLLEKRILPFVKDPASINNTAIGRKILAYIAKYKELAKTSNTLVDKNISDLEAKVRDLLSSFGYETELLALLEGFNVGTIPTGRYEEIYNRIAQYKQLRTKINEPINKYILEFETKLEPKLYDQLLGEIEVEQKNYGTTQKEHIEYSDKLAKQSDKKNAMKIKVALFKKLAKDLNKKIDPTISQFLIVFSNF